MGSLGLRGEGGGCFFFFFFFKTFFFVFYGWCFFNVWASQFFLLLSAFKAGERFAFFLLVKVGFEVFFGCSFLKVTFESCCICTCIFFSKRFGGFLYPRVHSSGFDQVLPNLEAFEHYLLVLSLPFLNEIQGTLFFDRFDHSCEGHKLPGTTPTQSTAIATKHSEIFRITFQTTKVTKSKQHLRREPSIIQAKNPTTDTSTCQQDVFFYHKTPPKKTSNKNTYIWEVLKKTIGF